mmetsp:Transcript_85401/g.135380  ORF Transcript_85401/g.135380 Transcript_85401/m.135380 type:complete len:82 (+) Transcript_85401:309-554(+)
MQAYLLRPGALPKVATATSAGNKSCHTSTARRWGHDESHKAINASWSMGIAASGVWPSIEAASDICKPYLRWHMAHGACER